MNPAYHQIELFSERRCCVCQQMRPRSEYCRNKKGRDGLDPRCYSCKSKRKREWYEKNAEEQRAYSRRYTDQHRDERRAYARKKYQEIKDDPQYREARKTRCEEWRNLHPDGHRIWRGKNMERLRIRARINYHQGSEQAKLSRRTTRRLAYAKNPERARLIGRQKTANRRAKIRSLQVGEVSYTAILERDQSICHICGIYVERQNLRTRAAKSPGMRGCFGRRVRRGVVSPITESLRVSSMSPPE